LRLYSLTDAVLSSNLARAISPRPTTQRMPWLPSSIQSVSVGDQAAAKEIGSAKSLSSSNSSGPRPPGSVAVQPTCNSGAADPDL